MSNCPCLQASPFAGDHCPSCSPVSRQRLPYSGFRVLGCVQWPVAELKMGLAWRLVSSIAIVPENFGTNGSGQTTSFLCTSSLRARGFPQLQSRNVSRAGWPPASNPLPVHDLWKMSDPVAHRLSQPIRVIYRTGAKMNAPPSKPSGNHFTRPFNSPKDRKRELRLTRSPPY